MSNKNAPASIKLQSSFTRNGRDWKYEIDHTGRHVLKAHGKGVKYRIGILTAFLKNQPQHETSRFALLEHLQSKDSSYTDGDLSQPIAQMRQHGIITARGRGADAVYRLTARAQSILANARWDWS